MGKGRCSSAQFAELALGIQACIVTVCCFGPILIIVGVVFIVMAATPEREGRVEKYNQAASAFDEISESFRETEFYFLDNQLLANTEADLLNDLGRLDSYSPFKYVLGSIPLENITSTPLVLRAEAPFEHFFGIGEIPPTHSFIITKTEMGCRSAGEVCDRKNPEEQARCLSQPECPEACALENGDWSETGLYCAATHHLNSICFNVDQPSSSWVVNTDRAAPGCYYMGKEYPGARGNVDPRMEKFNPGIYSPNMTSEVTLTLRHSADPYILASDLTFGSYYFGLSVGEKISTGVILAGLGFVLFIAISAGVVVFVRWMLSTGRGHKGHWRNGGLEKVSSGEVQIRRPEPKPVLQPQQPQHHKPQTHIINIYMSQTQVSPYPQPASPLS